MTEDYQDQEARAAELASMFDAQPSTVARAVAHDGALAVRVARKLRDPGLVSVLLILLDVGAGAGAAPEGARV